MCTIDEKPIVNNDIKPLLSLGPNYASGSSDIELDPSCSSFSPSSPATFIYTSWVHDCTAKVLDYKCRCLAICEHQARRQRVEIHCVCEIPV